MEPAPAAPAKRGMGWRLWAVIAIVIIVIGAGVAYYATRPSGPTRDTKTLIYYMQSEPVTMDPADAYDLWSFVALQNTYDTLIGYNRDTTQLVPELATSWTVSPSGLNYTFTLRQGVKFCDGSAFTANDVYASFRKVLLEASPESSVAWILNQTMDPTNIRGSLWVKNINTIQMNLTAPYAAFLSTLATVEPSAIMSGAWIAAHGGVQKNTANPYIKQNTMGTGPYCMSAADWVKGSQMTLRQNPNFWRNWTGKEPTTIVMKFTNEPTSRVEAIRTGAADVADLPLSAVSQVSTVPGVSARGNETIKSEIATMNTKNAFMTDNATGRLVRQAFSYAFDYNATIAQDYAGFASLLPGPIPKGMAFYDQQSQLYYQNLRRASLLLNQSGYVGDSTGVRFGGYAFRIVADRTQLEEVNAARRWQQTLTLIGVQSDVIIKPSTSAWDTARSNGDYDFFIAHWVPDYLDPDDYVTPMVVNATKGGDYWHTGFDNYTTSYYGVKARSEQTSATRAADYRQVWQAAMANPNMIWFCAQQFVPIHQDYIHGFWFNPVTWYSFYFYQKT